MSIRIFIRYIALTVFALFLLPTPSFAAGSKTITRGDVAVINWSVTNAPNCAPTTNYTYGDDNVYPNWNSAGGSTSGSVSLGTVTHSGTYTFTCTHRDANGNIDASDSVTLYVNDCGAGTVWDATSKACVTAQGPTATLTQNVNSSLSGQTYYISWSSTNANSCTLTRTDPDGTPNSISSLSSTNYAQSPNNVGTYNYSFACTGAGGNAQTSMQHVVSCPSGTAWNGTTCATVTSGCASAPASWMTSCAATLPTTANGVSTTVTNTTSGYSGSATYTCTNNAWSAPTNASCSATGGSSFLDIFFN